VNRPRGWWETPIMDPSMDIAWLFGTHLCPPQPLPASLRSFQRRAELVHAIDGPFWKDLQLFSLVCVLARRVGEVAELPAPLVPDVPDPLQRLSIALRLWAGCLDAAKTIAPETNSGPNTPEDRARIMPSIDARATEDAVYRAGVEAAPAFKPLRDQPYSMDGVPDGSPVRIDANTPA
jgi:hypothetical protein